MESDNIRLSEALTWDREIDSTNKENQVKSTGSVPEFFLWFNICRVKHTEDITVG